jgi:hypothetical protein
MPVTRTSEGGGVTVAMNTHMADLDGYDLRTQAVLRSSQGITVVPKRWTAAPDGHHREGQLRFPLRSAQGRPVLVPARRWIQLTIRHVAGVPARTFTWTLSAFVQR